MLLSFTCWQDVGQTLSAYHSACSGLLASTTADVLYPFKIVESIFANALAELIELSDCTLVSLLCNQPSTVPPPKSIIDCKR